MNDSNDQRSSNGSTKPYLLRAIHEWAVDNQLTPQILVLVNSPEVVVPGQYVDNNQIVLNIHPQSVQGLQINNDFIWFSARFSGKAFEVTVPVSSVLAIYSRENGQGIFFQSDGSGVTPPTGPTGGNEPEPTKAKDSGTKKPASPALKLVK